MLFDVQGLVQRRNAQINRVTYKPTGWRVPDDLPDLSNATEIGFDTETYDPDLSVTGPGWYCENGRCIGVSISTLGRSWYVPTDSPRHLTWVKHCLESPVPKIGANIAYDVGWLSTLGVNVRGTLFDVQFAEALIDEHAFRALNVLGNKYLRRGKKQSALDDWLRASFPMLPERDLHSMIHRAPLDLVGPYAEEDASLPVEILRRQWPIMEKQGLIPAFLLECRLIPLFVAMRKRGVRVDVNKAKALVMDFETEIKNLFNKLEFSIPNTGAESVAWLLEKSGVAVPKTATGKPSVTSPWLAGVEHPSAKIIRDIREREKLIGTFLKGYIIDKNDNGRIHPEFNQMGTQVYRLSSSKPNLQNIPTRTKLGKLVRECFVTDIADKHWTKLDFSQLHYRILAHYAVGVGADELRERYCNDPKTDFHFDVLRNIAPVLGWDITDKEHNEFVRRPIKNVNFGCLYGLSWKELEKQVAGYFGDSMTTEQVKSFFDAYFEKAPYIKATMAACANEVQEQGYITSILGRRCRFNLWEPARRFAKRAQALPYGAALDAYGANIKRAFDYRGINYKFQSSEPDIMKQAMLDCYDSGVFNAVGFPLVTVHDELDFSVPHEQEEALNFVRHTMSKAIKLRVPLQVDRGDGESWAAAR